MHPGPGAGSTITAIMHLPNRRRGVGATIQAMYLIAIAWLYVALLAAVAEDTVVGGVLTFLFYGAGPLALTLWLLGAPARRERRKAREAAGMNDRADSEDRQ